MTIEQARQLVGRRPTWELKKMQKALSLHSWLNTPDEAARLEACKLVLSDRVKAQRQKR